MPIRTPSSHPTFAALDVYNTPVSPCGFSVLVYVLPPPFLKLPPPPLSASTCGSSPFGSKGGLASSSSLLSSSITLPLHPLLCHPISWCLLVVVVFFWAPFCAFMRGLGVSTCLPLPSSLRYLAVQDRFRPPDPFPFIAPYPFPICVLLITSPSVLVVRGFREQQKILQSW